MRYALKPCFIEDDLWEDQKKSHIPSLEVDGEKYTFTGLLNKFEQPIYRVPEPFGFCNDA